MELKESFENNPSNRTSSERFLFAAMELKFKEIFLFNRTKSANKKKGSLTTAFFLFIFVKEKAGYCNPALFGLTGLLSKEKQNDNLNRCLNYHQNFDDLPGSVPGFFCA